MPSQAIDSLLGDSPPDRVRAYRAVVVATTACPWCGAMKDMKCTKGPKPAVGSFETTEDTFTFVDYVHDDRSAVHYLESFASVIRGM